MRVTNDFDSHRLLVRLLSSHPCGSCKQSGCCDVWDSGKEFTSTIRCRNCGKHTTIDRDHPDYFAYIAAWWVCELKEVKTPSLVFGEAGNK